MDLETKLGEQIRKLRKRQDLSIEELAFRAEIHHNYLGDIERGRRNPSIRSLEKIAQGLKVGIKELFNFETVIRKPLENEKYKLSQQFFSLIKDKDITNQKLLFNVLKALAKEIKKKK